MAAAVVSVFPGVRLLTIGDANGEIQRHQEQQALRLEARTGPDAACLALYSPRLLIGQRWKKENLPTIEEWTLKVSHLAEMPKISAYLEHSQNKYLSVWRRWVEFIEEKYGTKKYRLAFE